MGLIDISSRSTGLAKRLSNFTKRTFFLDGTLCNSMEGFLQSLKFQDSAIQAEVCAKVGYHAWKFGRAGNGWKKFQTLWWQGESYERESPEYSQLIRRAYEAMYTQCEDFRDDLLASIDDILDHSMGVDDPKITTLTRDEYILHLEHLRGLTIRLWPSP